MKNVLIGICLGCMLLMACQHEAGQEGGVEISDRSADGWYHVTVDIPAGERPMVHTVTADTLTEMPFLPYPVCAGHMTSDTLQEHMVWVFSERIGHGEGLWCKPLALLQYTELGVERNSLVMIPESPALSLFGEQTFEDFSIRRDAMKYAFEYWLRHRLGTGALTKLKWQDESAARQHIDGGLISDE